MAAYHDFLMHFASQDLIPICRTTVLPGDVEHVMLRYESPHSKLAFTVRCVRFEDAGLLSTSHEVRAVLDAFGQRYCTAEFSTSTLEPRTQTQARVDSMNRPCLITFWSGEAEPSRQAIVWPAGRGWHDMPSPSVA